MLNLKVFLGPKFIKVGFIHTRRGKRLLVIEKILKEEILRRHLNMKRNFSIIISNAFSIVMMHLMIIYSNRKKKRTHNSKVVVTIK